MTNVSKMLYYSGGQSSNNSGLEHSFLFIKFVSTAETALEIFQHTRHYSSNSRRTELEEAPRLHRTLLCPPPAGAGSHSPLKVHNESALAVMGAVLRPPANTEAKVAQPLNHLTTSLHILLAPAGSDDVGSLVWSAPCRVPWQWPGVQR